MASGTNEDTGAVNGTVNGPVNKRNPFEQKTDLDPDAWVQVRIRSASRDRFNAWFGGQYPGQHQLPARDPWVDRAFELGLERLETLMPAQQDADARFRAALEGSR